MGYDVPPGFRQVDAQSFCHAVVDGTHASPKQAAAGRRLVTSKHIKNGRVDLSTAYLISEADFQEINRRSRVDQWDVIFTMIGTIGESALVVDEAPDFAIKNVGLFKSRDELSGRWLYYFLQAPEARAELDHRKKGSTQQYISLGDLRSFPLLVPLERDTTQSIVSILQSFDDRIDLLRQTNVTLEAIAQALFKSWFVDFDPVRAKAERREPEGMDAVTAALFPSGLVDSELGLVPEGWKVDEIGNLVNCLGGGTPSTKDEAFWGGGGHHWATPKDLSGLQVPVLSSTARKITDAGLARISSGLLPVGTLLMSSRAPIGYLAIAAVPTAINQGFIAIPPGRALPPAYLLFWAKANMDLIKQKANGSTFMEISRRAFRPIKVLLPPPEILAAFMSTASPILNRIKENERHGAVLAETRDTLLPRLISGKLHLHAAEREIEAATA